MFARTIAAVSLLALSASAKPISKPAEVSARSFSPFSFNNYHGNSYFNGFDDFYGVSNFDGSLNTQVFAQENVLVCHQQDVTIIQQQMAILIENMKRVLTTQVCQVEAQTVLLAQVQSHFSSFSADVRHVSSRFVSYDHAIASHIHNLYDDSGNFNTADFGFSGVDVGSHASFVLGTDWSQESSPSLVSEAYSSAFGSASFGL
jgi:hypothetical protein